MFSKLYFFITELKKNRISKVSEHSVRKGGTEEMREHIIAFNEGFNNLAETHWYTRIRFC